MRIMFLNPSPRKATTSDYDRRVETLLNSYASAGTTVELAWPDDFGGAGVMGKLLEQGATNGLHHMVAIPSLVRKTVWAQDNGYDAVIQSNTFEPGVDAGRLAVRIPVIGLLRTALHTATMLADRVAMTVPFDTNVPYTWRIVRSHGLQDFVTDIRGLQMYTGPEGGASVAELTARSLEVMHALVKETRAEAIIPLGGLLFPYAVNPADLEPEVGVPVLNTKAIGIRFAEACVSFGMAQSRATYPKADLRYADFLEPAMN